MALPYDTTADERYQHDIDTAEEDEERPDWVLSAEEGRRIFDETARHYLGMSGEEFVRRWFGGEYEDTYVDTPELMPVIASLPLVVEPGSPEAKRFYPWPPRRAAPET